MSVLYPVAVPANLTVCAPADGHVQVYVVVDVDVRVIVEPETVPYDDVFCVNVPPSPQSA